MTDTSRRRTFLAAIAFAILAGAPPALAQEARPLGRAQARPPEAASEPQGFLREPDAVQRVILFGDRRLGNGELTNGWYIDTGHNMIPGAGWLSAGPGYRQWYANDRAVMDASAAISWHGYKTTQARVEFPRLAGGRFLVGSQMRWQDFPQVAYFGEGPASSKSNRSEYGLQSLNIVGYTTFRPVQWFGIGASVGWLKPSIESRVPDEPSFMHSEVSMTADTRDFAGHPTRGGLYRVSATDFSDRDTGLFSFRRYEAEAAQFLPLAQSRIVVALHGWLVGSDTEAGHVVPFYLQPALGGGNSLRGYSDYRFHDRNMLLVSLETRAAMMMHVDLALFMDAGNVAARVGDLGLDKRSYGAGLRLHSRRQTFARIDVARSDEGWRFLLRLDDPLNLARLGKRTAPAPFVH
ncbi:MAG: BamA/TamA family outer membrane protein [Vicinamibacterales bacterium]